MGARVIPDPDDLSTWDRSDPKPEPRIVATKEEWWEIRFSKLLMRQCRVCGEPAESLHHIVPKSQRGDDVADNCAPVCGSGTTGCHGKLEAMDLEARTRFRATLLPEEVLYACRKQGIVWLDSKYPRAT